MSYEISEQVIGNTGDELRVSSGYVVLIDQFMLGNSQFATPALSLLRSERSVRDISLDFKDLVERYGGCLIELSPGLYRIFRDPEKMLMVMYSKFQGEAPGLDESFDELRIEEMAQSKRGVRTLGRVFVDTRCLVFVDVDLIRDEELLARYKLLRDGRRDKDARDFLRARGAVVRYGFQRLGDELGVFHMSEPRCIALWPDVVEASP
ncbi:MAG: hypothetical protein IT291_08855 [Deltaproteobacteria bacterium]|nr:hypothetical protein [Deltaproteobacteria bacterium]